MCAYHVTAPQASGSSAGAWLAWVGGGERRELREDHERSAHAVAGVVVLATVALTWLVTTLAVMQATRFPVLAIAPFTLVFALRPRPARPAERRYAVRWPSAWSCVRWRANVPHWQYFPAQSTVTYNNRLSAMRPRLRLSYKHRAACSGRATRVSLSTTLST
jgi:hypothetical protein